ncbi:MAG: hypothetical protein U0228_23410 [Myxococcaceae bacterium]
MAGVAEKDKCTCPRVAQGPAGKVPWGLLLIIIAAVAGLKLLS